MLGALSPLLVTIISGELSLESSYHGKQRVKWRKSPFFLYS
uniref:Uncharacterized protein n=1 Tax=Rhizophora mucronata TaxID=61149 RepID=A0A2P2PQR8_RHIMU